jgi:N-acetylneuraminic acid mutarotase
LGPSAYLNDGGQYDPAADAWSAATATGAPSVRVAHTAVWTGSTMIVWGGYAWGGPSSPFNDGGRYDPAADAWSAMTMAGAPSARAGHTAVWTGSRMIVWGGRQGPAPGPTPNSGGSGGVYVELHLFRKN